MLTVTLGSLCCKFFRFIDSTQRLSNGTQVSVNFMSHAGWTELSKKLDLELKWLPMFPDGAIFFQFFYLIADIFSDSTGSKKKSYCPLGKSNSGFSLYVRHALERVGLEKSKNLQKGGTEVKGVGLLTLTR